MIQTVAPERPDEPFRVRILPQRPHCLPGLTGFELPDDDLISTIQMPKKGPATLAAFTPIRQVFQSDGQNAIWRFESSQPSQVRQGSGEACRDRLPLM